MPIINGMDAEKIILALLLTAVPGSVLNSSDFYLCQIGPAPLRFAPEPPSKAYTWPVPLKPVPRETNNVTASDSAPVVDTNSVLSATSPPVQPVTPPPTLSEALGTNLALLPQIPLSTEGNLLSASNLLIVTPQMLADYLKANLENLTRSSTNGFPGADVPFNPPVPKPPSSEATYKTQ